MKQTFEDPGFDRVLSSLRSLSGSSAFACASRLVSLASQDFISRVDSCRRSFLWSLCITVLSFQWKLKGANQPAFNPFGGIVNDLNPVIFTFSCAEIGIRHDCNRLLALSLSPLPVRFLGQCTGSPVRFAFYLWKMGSKRERGVFYPSSYSYSLVMLVSILLHVDEKCTLPAYPVNTIGFHATNGNRGRLLYLSFKRPLISSQLVPKYK